MLKLNNSVYLFGICINERDYKRIYKKKIPFVIYILNVKPYNIYNGKHLLKPRTNNLKQEHVCKGVAEHLKTFQVSEIEVWFGLVEFDLLLSVLFDFIIFNL